MADSERLALADRLDAMAVEGGRWDDLRLNMRTTERDDLRDAAAALREADQLASANRFLLDAVENDAEFHAMADERDELLAEIARLRDAIGDGLWLAALATIVRKNWGDNDMRIADHLEALLAAADSKYRQRPLCPTCGDNGDCGETAVECGDEFHGDGRH